MCRNHGEAAASSAARRSAGSSAGASGGGAALSRPSAEASSTERMPRMVAVLPVPGGPWMSEMPRPHSDARMAASCEGLYAASIARSSAAGGCSDCGAVSFAVLPGESSAGASASSRTE